VCLISLLINLEIVVDENEEKVRRRIKVDLSVSIFDKIPSKMSFQEDMVFDIRNVFKI